MTVKFAINGFGRIGRLLFRASIEQDVDIELVAVNDLTNAETLAQLLRRDSVHGDFPGTVEVKDGNLVVLGQEIKVYSIRDPTQLPWKENDVFLAAECTGLFTDRENASKHLKAGAEKVLISAPAKNPDITMINGVNIAEYNPKKHDIISNASCTTNCVAPVSKVLDENFGIEGALMTTVHAVTNDQRLLDLVHKDPRRSRSAIMSIIPTTTGAAIAATKVYPKLEGKMNGLAMRVPIPNVSIVDLTALLSKEATKEEINCAFKQAAHEKLHGILDYTDEPIVSIDINHNPHSAIIDGLSTMVVIDKLAKVLAWYDNEWGFSCRMAEVIEYIGTKSGY